jgi:transposase InsO family protein
MAEPCRQFQVSRKTGYKWVQRFLDGGVPIGGLSALSVWWVKLGILPERTEPGHPEQNGRHERMHRTLKAEVASPPRSDWDAQRAALEHWRKHFNESRPRPECQPRLHPQS